MMLGFVHLYSVVVQILLEGKNLEEGAAGEGDSGKINQGELYYDGLLHHQAIQHIFLMPPFPLHLLLLVIILFLPLPPHPPPSPPPSGGLEGLQALPPDLQGPVGQAQGCVHTGLASSSIRVPI